MTTPSQIPAALCGLYPGARTTIISTPKNGVGTAGRRMEDGCWSVRFDSGDFGWWAPEVLSLLLDSPLALCHAARWLATRLGCDPGVTAPMWFPEEGDWTMREWIMPVLGGRLVFNETGWCGNHDAIPCQKVRGISRVTDPAAALAAACLAVGGAS